MPINVLTPLIPKGSSGPFVAQWVENLPAVQETQEMWIPCPSLGWEDPLGKGMATHSSIFAWRLPMDRGAWRVTVQWVVESRTRLNDQVWISCVNKAFNFFSFRKSVGRVVVGETWYWPVFRSGNLRWQFRQLLFYHLSPFSFFFFFWKLVGEYSGQCCPTPAPYKLPTPAPDKLRRCRLLCWTVRVWGCVSFSMYICPKEIFLSDDQSQD